MAESEGEKSGKKTFTLEAKSSKDKEAEHLSQDYEANRSELSDAFLQIRAQLNSANRQELKENDDNKLHCLINVENMLELKNPIQNKEQGGVKMTADKYRNVEKKANDNVENRAELDGNRESLDNRKNRQDLKDTEDTE